MLIDVTLVHQINFSMYCVERCLACGSRSFEIGCHILNIFSITSLLVGGECSEARETNPFVSKKMVVNLLGVPNRNLML